MKDAKKIDNSCSEVSQATKNDREAIEGEMSDAELAQISGGPHFRTWDSTFYDY